MVGIGTGTTRPSRSRCWRSSVSQARSASLLAPRRPTASWPRMRKLHTSLATPPLSGAMRAASSPHRASASHPTGEILDQLDCHPVLAISTSTSEAALGLPHRAETDARAATTRFRQFHCLAAIRAFTDGRGARHFALRRGAQCGSCRDAVRCADPASRQARKDRATERAVATGWAARHAEVAAIGGLGAASGRFCLRRGAMPPPDRQGRAVGPTTGFASPNMAGSMFSWKRLKRQPLPVRLTMQSPPAVAMATGPIATFILRIEKR